MAIRLYFAVADHGFTIEQFHVRALNAVQAERQAFIELEDRGVKYEQVNWLAIKPVEEN